MRPTVVCCKPTARCHRDSMRRSLIKRNAIWNLAAVFSPVRLDDGRTLILEWNQRDSLSFLLAGGSPAGGGGRRIRWPAG